MSKIALRLQKYNPLFCNTTDDFFILRFIPGVKEWLQENIGPGGVYTVPSELDWNDTTFQWRMKKILYKHKINGEISGLPSYALLEFRTENQAMMFKLRWGQGVRHRSD